MDNTLRCFVAIDLPPELKTQLTELIVKLKASSIGNTVRWVRPSGIHLTLKFLGDVPTQRRSEIEAAVKQGISSPPIQAFNLAAGGLGVFPKPDQPRIIWVGLSGDLAKLSRTQKQVEQALAQIGFPPENRAFSPHLTLGRIGDVGSEVKKNIGEYIRNYDLGNLADFKASEAVLMQSMLHPDGAIYTPLTYFKFEE